MESIGFINADSSHPSVCIVDDEESVLRGMMRLLRSADYNVHAFQNPREFMLSKYIHESDCFILDVLMPEMTGLQIYEWLGEIGMIQPVLFLTGSTDIRTSVHAMKRGAIDYLVKPVDEMELLHSVSLAVQKHAVMKTVKQLQQAIGLRYAHLTLREKEVLIHVIQGRLNKQIAWDLGISLKTVKVHRARAMEKMQANSIAELVHFCEVGGLLPSSPMHLN